MPMKAAALVNKFMYLSCDVVPGTLCSLLKPHRDPFLTSFEHLKLSTNHHAPTIVTFKAAAEPVLTFLLYRWHRLWGELGLEPCRIQRVIIGFGQGERGAGGHRTLLEGSCLLRSNQVGSIGNTEEQKDTRPAVILTDTWVDGQLVEEGRGRICSIG